ncbi:MAG: hypothetical protein OD918_08905 [Gammaproteobacteria bacterium]
MNEIIPQSKSVSLVTPPLAHDSARKHVTGEARYISDHACAARR